jgi:putative photosynthetic complex assembly protein 2
VVAAAGLALALGVITALWFAGTTLVAWGANRPRATFGRSLGLAGLMGLWGIGLIALSAHDPAPRAAYMGALGALMVWGWHELAFLSGAVTGPNRLPCPSGLSGLARFRAATAAVIHHELALAVTLALIVSLSWNASNPTGACMFGLLFVLRLSSKLAIYAGVPSFSDELLPPHLAYLKSYFGPRHFSPALIGALGFAAALTGWLAGRVLAAPAGSAMGVGLCLLFGLSALGLLEHVFLAIPLRDAALWRWAIPARTTITGLAGEHRNGL